MKSMFRLAFLSSAALIGCGGAEIATDGPADPKVKDSVDAAELDGFDRYENCFDNVSSAVGEGDWTEVKVIDSAHPYADSFSTSWSVRGSAGVQELRVVFERFELEDGYDFLTITNATGETTRHTGKKTGTTVVVRGDRAEFKLQSDSSVTGWGVRARVSERRACICTAQFDPQCGADGRTYSNACAAACAGARIAHRGECASQSWTSVSLPIDSPHPYSNNLRRSFPINHAGASQIRVHFTRIDTERGYDFVRILDASGRLVHEYTGRSTSVTTPAVSGSALTVQLVSDSSETAWGFSIDRIEVVGGGSTTTPTPSPSPSPTPVTPQPTGGLAVLGNGTHSVSNVDWRVIGNSGLRTPRDLEFSRAGELWVVNRGDDSTVTYFDVGGTNQRAVKRVDPFAQHFMEEVSSLAFGAQHRTYGRTFGTCQESRNTYNGQSAPNDFMGPSLWPSADGIYAVTNPEAEAANGFDLGSHLDMLHQSPLCMGIAWEQANVYWTFDGATGSISRYDFQADHAPGFDDHSDGIIARYVTGQVRRVAGVPSHMEIDSSSRLLYIADTGNGRIAALDTRSGTRGSTFRGIEAGTQFYAMNNATLTTVVGSAAGELERPSGLALSGNILFVTDNAKGRISAFDKRTGERLDYLDTGLPAGALMGITLDPQGRLYFADATGNRVIRVGAR